jgi:accessory colonization factor AcfC
MVQTIKKYLLYAALIGLVYMLLANHYIYVGGKDFRVLKKESLNLRYTFFSVQNKSPANIIKIDDLRWAGIGEILYEEGLVSKDQQVTLEQKFEYE